MRPLPRKQDESIDISLSAEADPNLSMSDLFANGPLPIYVSNVKVKKDSLSFTALDELLILRNELDKS